MLEEASRLLQQLENKKRGLSVKNGEYEDLMKKRATAEEIHSTAFAKEMLIQKSDGQSITLIKDLVKGNKHVAKLKFDLDVAEAMVKACMQSMKNIHAVMDGIRSQLAWIRKEGG